jgi:hypothetical protein
MGDGASRLQAQEHPILSRVESAVLVVPPGPTGTSSCPLAGPRPLSLGSGFLGGVLAMVPCGRAIPPVCPTKAAPAIAFECKQPLTEIDNRGRRLSGCMNCNIWWSLEGAKVRLSEEDFRALHQLRRG